MNEIGYFNPTTVNFSKKTIIIMFSSLMLIFSRISVDWGLGLFGSTENYTVVKTIEYEM